MCLILDANQASLFVDSQNTDFKPIFAWLEKDGRLVYGKKLREELYKIEKMKRLLLAYSAAGKARFVDEDSGEKLLKEKNQYSKITSNDHHIISLAVASKARIVCTHDQLLINDFGNRKILSKPMGKVYKDKTHKHLLKHHGQCKK